MRPLGLLKGLRAESAMTPAMSGANTARTAGRALAVTLMVLVAAGCTATFDAPPTPETKSSAPIASCFDGSRRQAALGAPRIRRLSRFELINTFESVAAGSGRQLAAMVPADAVIDGYDTHANALLASELYVDAVRRGAEVVAATWNLSDDWACQGVGCVDDFIRRVGPRLFRRALRATEHARYKAVFTAVANDETPEAGVRAVLEALLQSPSFLYRTELGDTHGVLTNDELASALSYALWAAPPDEALRTSTLTDPQVLRAQRSRLMKAPQARVALDHFTRHWLELDRLSTAVRDASEFPDDSPALRSALEDETLSTFAEFVASGASFDTLLTHTKDVVPAALRPVYGETWGPHRRGILGHGSVLLAHSNSDSPSPVHRGKLVRGRLLCQSLPPPPPGIDAALPDFQPGQTNRERFAEHSKSSACSGCHRLMDPIGLGFERFDALGRVIEADSSGEVLATGSLDGAFDGVPALAERLAASDVVASCFTSQWSRQVLGLDGDQASCDEGGVLVTQSARPASLSALLELPFEAPFFSRRSEGSPEVVEPAIPDAGVLTPMVRVTVRVDSMWATGSCKTVLVDNGTMAPVVWSVEQPKEGRVTNHWNSQLDASGSAWRFTGASYNATVAAGQGTSFGYCVSVE